MAAFFNASMALAKTSVTFVRTGLTVVEVCWPYVASGARIIGSKIATQVGKKAVTTIVNGIFSVASFVIANKVIKASKVSSDKNDKINELSKRVSTLEETIGPKVI